MEQVNSGFGSIAAMVLSLVAFALAADLLADMLKPSKSRKRRAKPRKKGGSGDIVGLAAASLVLAALAGGPGSAAGASLLWLAAVIAAAALLPKLAGSKLLGQNGERLCESELRWVRLLGRKGTVLRNAYVPKRGDGTSEIDVLFVTRKGVFVIESKNYSGWIFGSEGQRYWTAVQKDGRKDRFYNPVMQNASHVKRLREFLADGSPLFSIVAFSERCELKEVATSGEVPVIKRDRLYAAVRRIWDASPDALSEEQVADVVSRLKPLTRVDAAAKGEHVAAIRRRFGE